MIFVHVNKASIPTVCNIINIYNFIKLSGKEVEGLTKDFIKYVVELYAGPNRDMEINKDDFI